MVEVPIDKDLIDLVESNKLTFDRALSVQTLRELKKKEAAPPATVPEGITLIPSRD